MQCDIVQPLCAGTFDSWQRDEIIGRIKAGKVHESCKLRCFQKMQNRDVKEKHLLKVNPNEDCDEKRERDGLTAVSFCLDLLMAESSRSQLGWLHFDCGCYLHSMSSHILFLFFIRDFFTFFSLVPFSLCPGVFFFHVSFFLLLFLFLFLFGFSFSFLIPFLFH